MDQLLKCPKCLNIFNQPKSLDCNHILCLNCLSDIFKPDISPYIDCPICDKQTLVMNSTIELPSIPSLEELLCYYNSVEQVIPPVATVAQSSPQRSSPLSTSPTPLSPRYQRLITEPLHDPFYQSSSSSQQVGGGGGNQDFSLDQRPLINNSTSQSSNSSSTTTTSTTSTTTTTPTITINQNLKTSHQEHSSNVQSIVAQLSKNKQSSSSSQPSQQHQNNSPLSKSCSSNLHSSMSSSSISSQQHFSIVQTLPPEAFEDVIRCPLHGEKYKFYCTNKECDKLVCLECIIDHNGHQFNRIAKELENRMPDIESLTITMANLPNKLLKHKASIEKRIADGTTLHRDTKQKISSDIDLMIKNLIDRRDSLESQIDRDWEEQKRSPK
ncbi:hypothetical protein DFA_11984 [Cavenderia fasciculata]|uniref:RING-type domain-containing protein n=1 Tax=Cavenderia fasciculata TaxID=261658 RepID=F4QF61_CACFS|nr:uncharacterized protein DFA_11984 [Cavenderia fasciculata]EGG14215.1 hypothetical protein DFA_11984 [Cavenderia fasciculata]|eukprot:XP_004350923.1 hypothetical protein DFA_11984 [Cavenderia fasciculata]